MRKLVILFFAVTFCFATSIFVSVDTNAGTTCYTNAIGQIVCESDSGSSTWNENNDGSWSTNNARGTPTQTCTVNYLGQLVCN